MLDKATILAQIDAVLADYEQSKDLPRQDAYDGQKQAVVTRLRAAIARLAPPESEYVRAASRIDGHPGNAMPYLAGILIALRADFEAGYDQTLSELAHADVFADFLEMASELRGRGYKDAAAVIAGSTLEGHLRKLAVKASVPFGREDGTPLKADALNSELARIGAYNKLQQKTITAWLDLRNKAAHGLYTEYEDTQVSALVRDVRDFMTRFPA
jgi:hypothetical protein